MEEGYQVKCFDKASLELQTEHPMRVFSSYRDAHKYAIWVTLRYDSVDSCSIVLSVYIDTISKEE